MDSCHMILALPVLGEWYHGEQAKAARESANRLGVQLDILSAEEDAITQSQQLLTLLQSQQRPDAILLEPAGTCLPLVAQTAVRSGCAWAVLNREADYLDILSHESSVPVFSLSTDHHEVGRIQGRQIAAMLPKGGTVLYITGPSSHDAALWRTEGMMSTKPENVQIKTVRSNWTEEGAHHAMRSLFMLQTSRQMDVQMIVCQNDLMAIGVRKSLEEIFEGDTLQHWLSIPCTGCDGLENRGLRMVREHRLSATVIIPANAGEAVTRMEAALRRGVKPPLRSMTPPLSYPTIEDLQSHAVQTH